MISSLLGRVYAGGLLVIFGLIVLHAPLTVFLGTQFPTYDLLLKSWKEILMALLIPVAILYVSQNHAWRHFLKDPIIWFLGGYAVMHFILLALLYQGSAPTLAGLAVDLRYTFFFTLVYGLLRITPQYRKLFLRVGLIGAGIVISFGVLQLFLPADILTHIGYGSHTIAPYLTVDDNPAFIRINSTLRGPNPLGIYTVIILVMLFALWVRGKITSRRNQLLAFLLGLGSLVVLWVTYSRSALIAALIGAAVVALMRYGKAVNRWVWGAGVAVLLIGAGVVYAVRESDFVSNVILHNSASTGASVTSDEQHASSLIDGLRLMLQQPLGAGIGSTGSASLQGAHPLVIENQYLFIAHEVGWLGLVIFLALFILIIKRLWHTRSDWVALGVLASGIGIGIVGLLQPVWVDDTVSIIWWGLAAVALSKEGMYAKKTE
ncbi:MAG TPA: O-antigen ligase family protein [Candidatus Saccharimonadales bacterium]|nr:O-antigen ligase family protein [Candidatus Saccharimonadales bacterium]